MLVAAALMFAAVFVLRVELPRSDQLVTLLYAVPVGVAALELGVTAGLAAAALALALFALWHAFWPTALDYGAADYVVRGALFFVLAGSTGILADRLRRVSAQSERFWELSNDLLCTAGFDGNFKRLNPAWERTLGWTLGELRSRPFLDFVHPEDRERTEVEAANLERSGYETINFANRYRCKDGTYRSLLWSATASAGEGVIYAIARDITKESRANEELRSSQQFLDSVLENLPNMVFVKEAQELRFVRFNRAGEELLGVPRADLIGRNDHDLFPEHQAAFFVEKDREVLAANEVIDIPEEPIDTVGKGRRTLHTRKIAIRDESGEPRYLLGISEDVTDRLLAERAAETARAEAERANQAKSEFLSRMSHELRTPLNAVIGFAQLLELDDLDLQQRESVKQILKAGRHLLELINEVLDISRIESGTMSISLEPVHLGSALADSLSLVRPLADEVGVRLIADPSALTDIYVRADQQRLKQVLINLLSNAVKYNRQGGKAAVRCNELPDGRVEIAVADTGHGMTAEQLQRLFEPFDRLGADRTGVEGTGLGLSLTKGLVEAMGGTISAESEPQVGTTMRVWLDRVQGPRAEAAAGNGASTHAQAASTVPTILYVEDNLSNLMLVERVLRRIPGARLIPAMQGKLGIELARKHQPDLIILDLHLPDLHGREVLTELKRDPQTTEIPVVVMSADANVSQVQLLQNAGAASYLTKPIEVKSLLKTIAAAVTPG